MTRRRSPRVAELLDDFADHRHRHGPVPDLFKPEWEEPDSASPVWTDAALSAVQAAARVKVHLTVEDVDWPDSAHTVDERARGAVLLRAARSRIIARTDAWVPGGASRHGRPVRVWRSLLIRGADQ